VDELTTQVLNLAIEPAIIANLPKMILKWTPKAWMWEAEEVRTWALIGGS